MLALDFGEMPPLRILGHRSVLDHLERPLPEGGVRDDAGGADVTDEIDAATGRPIAMAFATVLPDQPRGLGLVGRRRQLRVHY